MWNAISLGQDLNSCRCVHFLRRYPLHHGHLTNIYSCICCQEIRVWPHGSVLAYSSYITVSLFNGISTFLGYSTDFRFNIFDLYELQLDVIHFLSLDFPFLIMSMSSRVQSRLFVSWNIHTVVFLPISVSLILMFFFWYLCCYCCYWLL